MFEISLDGKPVRFKRKLDSLDIMRSVISGVKYRIVESNRFLTVAEVADLVDRKGGDYSEKEKTFKTEI